MAEPWKKCTECRTDIAFGASYYQCSVSTCNRARMPLVFCSVVCWDCHLSSVRHRDAGAVEARAPSKDAWQREQAESAPRADDTRPHAAPPPPSEPVRRIVGAPAPAPGAPAVALADVADKDILIVVSKLKKYIKDRAGMNCSDAVADVLSEHVRAVCDDAIRTAARDERKTVLDRDVPRPRRGP
jgi:hypothetical protein